MKAVARTALAFCRVFPIQRWIGVTVLILLAALPLTALLPRPLSLFWLALCVIASACFMFAVFFPLGWQLRALSAASTHRLLPYFRGRMLAAACTLIALFPTLGYVLLSLAPEPPPAFAWFTMTALLVSAAFWFTFFLPQSLWSVLAVVPLTTLLRLDFETAVAHAPLLAAALIAAWLMFAAWYLRARAIPPMAMPDRWSLLRSFSALAALDARLSDRSATFGHASASEAGVTRRYPLRLPHRLGVLGFVLLIVGAPFSLALGRRGLERPEIFIAVLYTIAGTLLMPAAAVFARRARSLWLLAGKSRRQLFGVVENTLWTGPLFYYAAVFAVFGVYADLAFDVDLLWRAAPAAFASALLGTYLGLACVRRPRLAVGVSMVLVMTLALAALGALLSESSTWLARVIAVEVAVALTVRAVAIRLWKRIDWLALRPVPPPASRAWVND